MHTMIDIETLGLSNNAVITEIGAVNFDYVTGGEIEIEGKLDLRISVANNLQNGRTVDASTLEWWAKQDPVKFAGFFDPKGKLSLYEAWRRILDFLPYTPSLWCSHPEFDFGILKTSLPYGYAWPCPYQKHYDYASIRELYKGNRGRFTLPPYYPSHTAVEDAENQARRLCLMIHGLGLTL